MQVKRINRSISDAIVSNKHYKKKLGTFWEGFGLFQDDVLLGVIIYGQPMPNLNKSAFRDRDFRLYELTRLVLNRNIKNGASFLISNSLKMLSEQPCAVVSYADSAQGHCGIVYQATNWLYTGAVVAHDSMYLINGIEMHPISIRDQFGVTNPAKWAKENGYEKIKPKEKHRYFYIVGDKRQKRQILEKLNYPIIKEYPKLDKQLYEDGGECQNYLKSKETSVTLFD